MSVADQVAGSSVGTDIGPVAAFKSSPVSFSLVTLILVAAIGSAAVLAKHGNKPSLLNAAIDILPAVILTVSNLYRGKSHPDRWPGWLVIAGLAVAASVALQLLASFFQNPDIKNWISSIASLLAFLLLILTLLPPALSWASVGLKRIPVLRKFLGRGLSAPSLYVLLLLAVSAPLLLWFAKDLMWFAGFLVIPIVLAVRFRNTLFPGSQDPLLLRLLQHAPAWLWELAGLAGVVDHSNLERALGFDPDPAYAIIIIALASLTLISPVVLSARVLRRDPVPPLAATGTDRPDSIQSKATHYVDVNGRSARLVTAVERSDAGVFGVTGVRGAGKSALTRHVLAILAPRYFTLEVTAPVRHDPGIGFFMSICKAVCSKTLEALDPIVTGARVSAGKGLWQQLRNPLLAVSAMLCVISLLIVFSTSLPGSVQAPLPIASSSITNDAMIGLTTSDDPSLAIVDTERAITDALLAQIERVFDDERAGHGSGGDQPAYLIVPAPRSDGFWLLPTIPNTAVEARLASYTESLSGDFPDSFPRFFRDSGLNLGLRMRVLAQSVDLGKIRDPNWEQLMLNFVRVPAVSVPLVYLQPALRFHLGQNLPPGPSTKMPVETGGQAPPPQELMSQMLWNAFVAKDPHLEFNSSRLREFNDVLLAYRRALHGELGWTAAPAANSNSNSSSAVPAVTVWNMLRETGSFAAIAFWTAAGVFLLVLLARPAWDTVSRLAHAIVNRRYLDLYAEAVDFLEQLSFQLNQESSTGVSWQGISLGRKRTMAARDLTLPGLTARYTRFLAKLRAAYNSKVVIVIDELDKIHDPEQVKALLIEIKGALFFPGTFYLISISEDAARSFRRRLASGRDIFESTFDEVVEIRQMRVDSALAMLEKLEADVPTQERLPTGCLEVAALFGGGIPREIIRARRVLSYSLAGVADPTPAWAASTLLSEELDHWAAHLGEINVSGADTIRLRQCAQQATASLDAGGTAAERYNGVWNALDACVDIIDPSGLRNSVGYTADSASSPPAAGDAQAAHNQAWWRIQSDLQTVLRLMILTHLGEQIVQPGAHRRTYETPILRCHGALADKPALAETILRELRQQLYATASRVDASDQSG